MPRRLTPAQLQRMARNCRPPQTVAEVIDDAAEYSPDVLQAVKAFARSKPWRGTIEERIAKFRTLHAELCRIYDRQPSLRFMQISDAPDARGDGIFDARRDAIRIYGKLSVVTYLHVFGHALGKDKPTTARWSINLFRRCFPRSFAAAQHDGAILRKRSNSDA